MNDLVEGRVNSFEEIARNENKVERHIRHLAPLAFVSPRIVEAIANGSAPADLPVTALARALPHSWAGQETKLGCQSAPNRGSDSNLMIVPSGSYSW